MEISEHGLSGLSVSMKGTHGSWQPAALSTLDGECGTSGKGGAGDGGINGTWTVPPAVSLCGGHSPNSLDAVPPTIIEGAVHHDGCHTTAQVIAKAVGGEQGRQQNKGLEHRRHAFTM